MSFKFVFAIILLCSLSIHVNAQYFQKKNFKAAVGGQLNSLLYKRGMITYGGAHLTPIVSIDLFNPNFLIAGSAIYFKHEILKDRLILRTRYNSNSTPDHPLFYTSEKEGKRVKRDKTNELDFFLEYESERMFYFKLQNSIDLKAHHGKYYELMGHIPVWNFSKNSNKESLLLLGGFFSLGYGDSEHNEYLYGSGANKDAVNNVEYGLSIRSPKVIDMFWPTMKITRFEILGDQNRSASYVQEKSGWSLETLFAFKVW